MIPLPIPFLVALTFASAGGPPRDGTLLHGTCIESRTASVFAGACHYGSEATTGGREAVVAWHVDRGSHLGVDLAGADFAAAIAADANLADPHARRRSVLYVSDRLAGAQRAAALDLLRTRFSSLLGIVAETRSVPMNVAFDGESYRVVAGDLLEVRGALLPDRACCKMPLSVWYAPLAPIAGRIVGRNDVFQCRDEDLGTVWQRFDENSAFAGTFELAGDRADSPK